MPVFFDDFNGLVLDTSKWYMMTKQWGTKNHGIVMENVSFDLLHLVLEVHGDEYDGIIPGCRKVGARYPRVTETGEPVAGTRVGAGVATKAYFASGRYRARVQVLDLEGTWLAIGTYQYVEIDTVKGVEAFTDDVNLQIMCEKGKFAALLSAYSGTEVTTHKVPLPSVSADGFHTYRFDWHTQDPSPADGQSARRIDFFVDDELLHTIDTTVPTNAGRFMMATLFPDDAGPAPFNAGRPKIDWVEITPFNEAGDCYVPESYPVDGLVLEYVIGGR